MLADTLDEIRRQTARSAHAGDWGGCAVWPEIELISLFDDDVALVRMSCQMKLDESLPLGVGWRISIGPGGWHNRAVSPSAPSCNWYQWKPPAVASPAVGLASSR